MIKSAGNHTTISRPNRGIAGCLSTRRNSCSNSTRSGDFSEVCHPPGPQHHMRAILQLHIIVENKNDDRS